MEVPGGLSLVSWKLMINSCFKYLGHVINEKQRFLRLVPRHFAENHAKTITDDNF